MCFFFSFPSSLSSSPAINSQLISSRLSSLSPPLNPQAMTSPLSSCSRPTLLRLAQSRRLYNPSWSTTTTTTLYQSRQSLSVTTSWNATHLTTRSFHDTPPSRQEQQQEQQVTIRRPRPPRVLPIASQKRVDSVLKKILHLDFIEVTLLTYAYCDRLGLDHAVETNRSKSTKTNNKANSLANSSEEAAEEDLGPKTVELKLVGYDAKAKIKVIKEVRAMAELGLKDAKEMVESVPKVIMKDLKQEDAEGLKAKLEEIGAQVEIV